MLGRETTPVHEARPGRPAKTAALAVRLTLNHLPSDTE